MIGHDPAVYAGKNGPVSIQVDRSVPQKLKEAIWEDKYIELEKLLDDEDEEEDEDEDKPMTLVEGKPGQPVRWAKVKDKKSIKNIAQWLSAFNVFITVYSRRFPEQTPNLMAYQNKVKSLHQKGGDYYRYDKEFRKLRAQHGIPWEIPYLDKWLECLRDGNKANNKQSNTQSSFKGSNPPFRPQSNPSNDKPKLQHPAGYCYTYHNKGRCGRNPCKFSHMCWAPSCKESHSIYSCPKLYMVTNQSGKASAAPSAKPKSTNSSQSK